MKLLLILLTLLASVGIAHASDRVSESHTEWWGTADARRITSAGSTIWTEIVVELRAVRSLRGRIELVEVDRTNLDSTSV